MKRKDKGGGHASEMNALRVLDGQTVVDRSTGQRFTVCVPAGFNLDVTDALAAQTLATEGSAEPGSPRWYAALTREAVVRVWAALARNDAGAALAAAYRLGQLTREAEMVRHHGDAHIAGAAARKILAERSKRHNAGRRVQAGLGTAS